MKTLTCMECGANIELRRKTYNVGEALSQATGWSAVLVTDARMTDFMCPECHDALVTAAMPFARHAAAMKSWREIYWNTFVHRLMDLARKGG